MATFENITSVFSNETSFQRVSEANAAARDQIDTWISTIEKIVKSLNYHNSGVSIEYLDQLKSYIATNKSVFSVNETDSGYVVSGELPLITKIGSTLDSFIARKPVTMFGVVFAESGDIRKKLQQGTVIADAVVMLAGAYTAIQEVENVVGEAVSKIGTHRSTKDSEYSAALTDLENRVNLTTSTAQQTIEDIKSQGNIFTNSKSEEVKSFLEKAERQLEATKNLVLETESLKTARSIWHSKTAKHRKFYGAGLAIIILTVISMLAIIFYNLENIQRFISTFQKPDKELPYGVIVLLIIPVLSIAWILKMINKFATNNLILAEDSEQREAMIDTYFRLVGNPDAKMEPSDRILVLNAIFRPLPGQQSDDLNPPNLVDVVNSATAKRS
ncbi:MULTISPECIES: DUF6161 domain-containing protein [unclassified Methylobacterium]|uniref:DUF6161 domain-containing protein n=1 Tax=unclassified Methylobacterium TaxID=2615210 RepID=UPI0036FAF6B0